MKQAEKIKVATGFDLLDGHRAIGWDFDETLVDHENSPLIHRFINANRSMRHVIITFRTHGWQYNVFNELRQYRDAPHHGVFERVISVPERFWNEFSKMQMLRSASIREAKRPLTTLEREYLEWKGKVCKENGLTVLVDDMTNQVKLGCNKYRITHIHPDQLSTP